MRYSATIAVEEQTASTVTYRATFTKGQPGTASLWVLQKAYDESGTVVASESQPVVDEETGSGVTPPFSLGPWTGSDGILRSATHCSAYVWVYPDAFTPISGTVSVVI